MKAYELLLPAHLHMHHTFRREDLQPVKMLQIVRCWGFLEQEDPGSLRVDPTLPQKHTALYTAAHRRTSPLEHGGISQKS